MAEGGIRVNGSGVAALCCQQLLHCKADAAGLGTLKSPRLPAILVSQSTQKLLGDIFGSAQLFAGLRPIRERVVAWGSGEPVVVAHSAVVVSEEVLRERLRARLGTSLAATEHGEIAPEYWAIFTGSGAWSEGKELVSEPKLEQMHFGSRMAVVRNVELNGDERADACWVESVEDGWLFLLPTEQGKGSLISVGGKAVRLLANSRLVAGQVRSMNGAAVAEFGAYPRIMSRLCGDGWLACGSAAMAFDPLCGEGAGNAAREAILACAAVKAILGGESREDVLAEYEMRLLLGFLRHLENCREFYTRDAASGFWQGELRAIEEGIGWTKGRLEGGDGPRYRLVGFNLERIAR
jgi:hypothetical protein